MQKLADAEVFQEIRNGVTYTVFQYALCTVPFFIVMKENDFCEDEVIARGVGPVDLDEILAKCN
jgi:hypothetical protein